MAPSAVIATSLCFSHRHSIYYDYSGRTRRRQRPEWALPAVRAGERSSSDPALANAIAVSTAQNGAEAGIRAHYVYNRIYGIFGVHDRVKSRL